MPLRAPLSEMVVIVNVPLCVVGLPRYMYCMLLARLSVRFATRSIFRLRTGSRVSLSCTSSVRLVVAGVATESLMSSQSLRLALSM